MSGVKEEPVQPLMQERGGHRRSEPYHRSVKQSVWPEKKNWLKNTCYCVCVCGICLCVRANWGKTKRICVANSDLHDDVSSAKAERKQKPSKQRKNQQHKLQLVTQLVDAVYFFSLVFRDPSIILPHLSNVSYYGTN